MTIHDLVGVLRKSRVIVPPERLDAFLQERRDRWRLLNSPAQAAAMLLHGGLVSQFQAKHLLQGRSKGFWIKRYLVLEDLGTGGMGRVFLCEQTPMNRLVAVKVLPAGMPPGALERFLREARASAALDHPNIVRAFDVDHENRFHFLVMEFVDGPTLGDLVDEQGPLEIAPACHYAAQAALGLHHAHEAGWIHRDVKPGNLLLDRTGTVRVLDLGLARFVFGVDEQLTKQFDDQSLIGTADYIAPEQTLPDHEVDRRADVYSLGATIFFLLTGRPPYNEGNVLQKLMAHQLSDPPLLTQLRAAVPRELALLVQQMMAKDPAKRPPSAEAVVLALEPFAEGGPFPPDPRAMPNRCARVRQLAQAASAASAVSASHISRPAHAFTSRTPRPPQTRRTHAADGANGVDGAKDMERPRRRRTLLLAMLGVGVVVIVSGAGGLGWWGWGLLQGGGPALVPKMGPLTQPPDKKDKDDPFKGPFLSPQEAAQKVDQRCGVQFVVRSTGLSKSRTILFLNSEANYRAENNFAIVVHGIDRNPAIAVDDLPATYQNKTVRASGRVILFDGRPEIVLDDPSQVEIVADAKK
jgi:serine/threonine protein kinase